MLVVFFYFCRSINLTLYITMNETGKVRKWRKAFDSIRKFISRHIIITFMLLMVLEITIGLVHYTGWTYMPDLCLYVGSLLFFYFGLSWLIKRYSDRLTRLLDIKFINNIKVLNVLSYIVLGCIVIFMIYHLIFLGHIPVWTAYKSLDYYGIAGIRQSITEHHNAFIHYTSSMILKAVMPFLLLFFYIRKKWLFAVMLPIGIFYDLAMMQKAFIVTLLVPLIVYLFIKRKYLLSGVFAVLALAGVMLLIINASPSLRASEEEIKEYMATHRRAYVPQKTNVSFTETMTASSGAVFDRVMFQTGRDVGRWFTLIPDKLPYAKGCGYRLLAPILGCSASDYEYEHVIWDNLYIVEYNEGLRGTVTSAHFMYDYSNFGRPGLVLAGFVLACVFVVLNLVFGKHRKWLVSLNILYILWLTNVSLYSSLLSGGWILTILLFWLFRAALENE